MNPRGITYREWNKIHPAQLRSDIMVGTDWRILLGAEDRYVLQPVMTAALVDTSSALVYALMCSAARGSAPFHARQAYILARRAYRYARILEVLS